MAMGIDVGRGARRFQLPGSQTIGEGWVNDPRQAYNFSKAGITPQDTGELEGVHGEGVTGAQPGLGPSAAIGGLKSAMGGYGGGSGGVDEAPGTSLMRRLTATPDMASRYGIIANPEDVAARSTILQHQADDASTPAYQKELEREDVQSRAGGALTALKAQMAGPNQDQMDLESERAAQRLDLPWAAHNRYSAQQDLLERMKTQYLDPEALRAGAAGDTADATLAGHQATAQASQVDAAIRGLASAFESESKARTAGSPTMSDIDYRNLFQRLTKISHQEDVKK